MLRTADSIDSGTTLTADVCVIGAGAAGITIALELERSGLSVLLLESGNTEQDPETQALYEGTSVGEPFLTLSDELTPDQVRLRYLGGTTNHWAGFCRPLEEIDFEPRDHLDVSGWPIGPYQLEPFWHRAAEWVAITDAEFNYSTWRQRAELPGPILDTDAVHPIVFQISFPMRFGERYRDELRSSDSIDVILDANVVNLSTGDGQRITGVDARTLSGGALRAEASAYVLATGGIENARLLLASTDSDPRGLANTNDLVGRYFTEHLQIYAGFGVTSLTADDLVAINGVDTVVPSGRHAGSLHGVKAGLALTPAHVRSAATTGLEVQLLTGNLPAGVPFQESGATANDVADLLRHEGQTQPTSLYLQGLAEQRLNRDSRVLLGSGTDTLGMRRVEIDWHHMPADRANVVAGLRVMAEEFAAAGLGRLQILPGGVGAGTHDHVAPGEFISIYSSSPGDYDPNGFPLGVGFHHMCTTRMAADPAEGVVDADCRAHGIDNLWISGSSVFSTGGVATPTFTIVALAVRLADHLSDLLT